MPTYKIELRKIKNISSLEINYPATPGVYLISGCNGCGKSTLLVALHRLCDKNAFSNYFSPTPLYDYNNAEIQYSTDVESVIYKKKAKRWPPHPKNNNKVIDQFPPSNSLLITASGIRFFSQLINVADARMNDASDFIKTSMNFVFGTNVFSNLKYKQIKPKRGKLKVLPRPYKLYIMDLGRHKKYDENNFSLGERLVLNTLELISNAEPHSQILIDEVELALHPVAQANFYSLLKELATQKSLYIFISTHSATLVKLSNKNYHLKSGNNGQVEVLTNSYPAYILSNIGVDENYSPDKIFFVEDDMAAEFLRNIIDKITSSMKINPNCIVIPIGGYPQVVEFLINYHAIEPNENKTHAMVDADVKETFMELKRSSPHDPLVEKMDVQIRQRNLDYLDITPEVGFWKWISDNPNLFRNMLALELNNPLGGWNEVVDIREIENLPESVNPRKTAKTRLNSLIDKLESRLPELSKQEIRRGIIKAYVRYKGGDEVWLSLQKSKLMRFLNS